MISVFFFRCDGNQSAFFQCCRRGTSALQGNPQLFKENRIHARAAPEHFLQNLFLIGSGKRRQNGVKIAFIQAGFQLQGFTGCDNSAVFHGGSVFQLLAPFDEAVLHQIGKRRVQVEIHLILQRLPRKSAFILRQHINTLTAFADSGQRRLYGYIGHPFLLGQDAVVCDDL